MKKRFLSFLTAFTLLCGLLPGAAAVSDISGHWAKTQISLLSGKGIMVGNGSGIYRPDQSITRSEFAALINRTFGFAKEDNSVTFSDISGGKSWKSEAINRAAAFGYMLGSNGKAYPDNKISRQEAATMLIRVLKLPLETGNTDFKDDVSIASWAKDYIATAEKYGIFTAMPSGNFEPASNLSRAQAATILVRAMGELYNKAGRYEGGSISGNATISTSDITLQNTTVSGNLYLTEGIGEGTVKLINVTVNGMVFVSGGGEGSGVIAENCTFGGDVSVLYPNKYLSGVRFAVGGSTSVKRLAVKAPAVIDSASLLAGAAGISGLTIDKSCTSLGLAGKFGEIALEDPATALSIDNGIINKLTLSNSTSLNKYQVTVLEKGVISNLNLNSPTAVSGAGSVDAVSVSSADCTIGAETNVNINKITLINGMSIKVGSNTLMPYGESAELSNIVIKSDSSSEDEIPMDKFSPSGRAFSAYSDAKSVRVYPYAKDGVETEIKVNGKTVKSGSFVTADTSAKGAVITLQVTSPDKNSAIYTITMAELVEAKLSALSVYNSDNKISTFLQPAFDPDETEYTVYTSGTNIKISATADKGQSVGIDGSDAKADTASKTIILVSSKISVDITATNSVGQSKTYTVNLMKKQTGGAIYRSGSTEGVGNKAEWTVKLNSPSEGDTFSIDDKTFTVGDRKNGSEQISVSNALSDIAKEYANNTKFNVSADTDKKTLTFENKTPGSLSTSIPVTCNIGTVTKKDGVIRKNGITTLAVTSLPKSGGDPVEININDKAYRLCPLASDVSDSCDISMAGVTTTAQAATLLEKKLSNSTTGGFSTSLSGSSIVISAGEIDAPEIECDNSYFTVKMTQGNAATSETYTIKFDEINEGQLISITVDSDSTDFEAHDNILISEDSAAEDVSKAFLISGKFDVSTDGRNTLRFQSKILGSAGNSLALKTSGLCVSKAEQTIFGKDTKLGSAILTVSKTPKYGDVLKIDSKAYIFTDDPDTDNGIDISDAGTAAEVAKAIRQAIGDSAKVTYDKINIASESAEAPEVSFISS
ncbi:MAG: S-layer homology domain-containing protein [Bacillota bacterium]|nr:S-layer homology domain-containing protein [Bacillota bacterium]